MTRPPSILQRPSALVLLSLVLLSLSDAMACRRPRTLETRFGSRKAETLQARAERIQGGWRVSMPLPDGKWKIEPFEAQAFDLIEGGPAATLRWEVGDARWGQYQKPFVIELVDDRGLRLPLTVRYPQPSDHAVLKNIGEYILFLVCTAGKNQ